MLKKEHKSGCRKPSKADFKVRKMAEGKDTKHDGSGQAHWEAVPIINMYTPKNIASRYRSNRRKGSRHILNLCLESSLLITP